MYIMSNVKGVCHAFEFVLELILDRAGSMVEQKMQPPKAPSKKKAPKF